MTAPTTERESTTPTPTSTAPAEPASGASGDPTAHLDEALDRELSGDFREGEDDILEPGAPGAAFGEKETVPEPVKPDAVAAAEPVVPETPEPEPLPFKYRADGVEKTREGVFEVPGQGLIVEEAATPWFRNVVQDYDHQVKRANEAHGELQRFEAAGGWSRVEELVGREAVFTEVGKIMLDLLDPKAPLDERGLPAKLARLAESQEARELLAERLNNLTEQSAFRARQQFQQTLQTTIQERQSQQTEATIVPYAVSELAKAVKANYGVDLTADDLKEAEAVYAKSAGQMYRLPTAQEAQQLRIPPNQRIVDYSYMHPWFEARAALRQREAQSRPVIATATTENAQRLAQTTPTRPANKHAAPQRPGNGKSTAPAAPVPASPPVNRSSWKRQMLMGKSLTPDAPPNANP